MTASGRSSFGDDLGDADEDGGFVNEQDLNGLTGQLPETTECLDAEETPLGGDKPESQSLLRRALHTYVVQYRSKDD